MPEYQNVEKPFLEKLVELGWEVINQGGIGIPQDSAKSLRENFKQVTLKQVFKDYVHKINTTNYREDPSNQSLKHK